MGIKTILVEDSKTIRDTLIPAMAELGGMDVVAVAETAREAMDQLSQMEGVWQLAVVDLFLKQGSGLDVLRACGSRRRDRVVVVLSNYATDDMRKECRALGADRVFDKSTELDAFFDFCASHFSPAECDDRMHGLALAGSAVSASQCG
jgi:DNA-binding NarL/FixJ family response regulator